MTGKVGGKSSTAPKHRTGWAATTAPRDPIFAQSHDPLPGTTPRPYYTHLPGECRFILEEAPEGSLADAMCCCAPVPPRESWQTPAPYCEGHAKITMSAQAQKNPASVKELMRSLRRVI